VLPQRIDNYDLDSEYQRTVQDRTRDGIKLDFGQFHVDEATYADCFKPNGYMHSEILHLVCYLWSMTWTDRIILDEGAVVSTYPRT